MRNQKSRMGQTHRHGAGFHRLSEFHGNRLMHLGHALMLLTVPLLIVVSLKFMDMLTERGAWLGFIGCVMAVFGAVMLAVDETALCLVPSALDTLPEAQFAQMPFGLVASVVLTVAMLPIGVQLIAGSNRQPSEKH